MLTRLFAREPVMVTLLGSSLVWAAVFKLLETYGFHPSIDQQSALIGLFVTAAGVIARSQVSPTK